MSSERITREQANERASLIALAKMQGATFANVPGRYDGASDRRLAQALDVLDADEEAGSVETTGAHLARFGRFIRKTDEQGFVDVLTFDSPREASAEMAIVADVEAQLGDFNEEVISSDGPAQPWREAMVEAALSDPSWRPQPGMVVEIEQASIPAMSARLAERAEVHTRLEAVAALDAEVEGLQAQDSRRRGAGMH